MMLIYVYSINYHFIQLKLSLLQWWMVYVIFPQKSQLHQPEKKRVNRSRRKILTSNLNSEFCLQSERGLLVPYLIPRAWGCQRLHPIASRVVREVRDASDRLRVPGSTPILCTLSKSDRVVITSRGLLPVTHLLDRTALSSPCLLITTWQLVKAHGVIRNEPKIYVICYITIICGVG